MLQLDRRNRGVRVVNLGCLMDNLDDFVSRETLEI